VNETVEIVGIKDTRSTVVRAWKCSRSCWTKARRETTLAALPRVERKDIERGQVSRSRVDHAAHKFKAEAYVRRKKKVGRHTPFLLVTGRSFTFARRT